MEIKAQPWRPSFNLTPMERHDWVFLLSIATLTLAVGAIYVLLFSM